MTTNQRLANNMRTAKLLIAAAALLIFPACKKELQESPGAITSLTTNITGDIVMQPLESRQVSVKVLPEDVAADVPEFKLLDEGGRKPAVLALNYEKSTGNTYFFTINDIRDNHQAYEFSLHFQYGGISSDSFTVRSAGEEQQPSATPVPIVYITTSVAQNRITKDTWVDGKIRIDGNGSDYDLEEMATQIKGRGNSTWNWEKKPYALKLDKKQSLIGRPKHKRWCLIANYMDKTDMRNRLAYHIAANTKLDYAVGNEFAEVYFNGAYQGLYMITEQVKEDANRVNITEVDEKSTTTNPADIGYLLEFDTYYDEAGKFTSATTRIPVNIKYPDREDFQAAYNDAQFQKYLNYIKGEVDAIDKAVAALASGGRTSAVWDKLDKESMIEVWLVYEVMCNHEMLWPKSLYFYKEKGNKLKAGPVWDFDWGTLKSSEYNTWLNYNVGNVNEGWGRNNWWNVLLKYDSDFKASVKRRWQEMYPFLLTLPSFVDSEKARIAEAEVRNRAKWPNIKDTTNPNGDESLSFDNAVARLKSTLSSRIEWLNSQISNW